MNSLRISQIMQLALPTLQVFPATELVHLFGELTIPMAEEVHVIQRQVENLRRTRDLLLPRFLSSQIDVEALSELVLSES